ncbi:MAG: hypothetical protein WAQ98_06205 [Blastocatellia bacterium]
MRNVVIENIESCVGKSLTNNIINWWNNRDILLILNEVPSSMQSQLSSIIARLTKSPVYKLSANKSTSKAELYQLLKQSLNDENQDVIVLIEGVEGIEELEELESQETFQILLLAFLQESVIRESDLTTVAPKSGKSPHLMMVSTQQMRQIQQSLSRPILRRSMMLQLPNTSTLALQQVH